MGRAREGEVLDQLLANVRRGHSAVLVVRGEAGIGKTALLRHAVEQASGFRIAQVAGVERIIVTTPPRTLSESPAVATALLDLDVKDVYAVGGAQA